MLRNLIRELKVKQRNPSGWLYPVVFFVMVLVLFPLAVGASTQLLHSIAVPIVLVAAILSTLLGVDDLFNQDVKDGFLELLISRRDSVTVWVMIKMLVHWLGTGLVLVVLSFISIPFFGLTWQDACWLSLSLLLITPILTLFTGMAAALTASVSGHHLMMPLIAIPLQIPVLIFSSGIVSLYQTGQDPMPIVALVAAMLIAAVLLIPFVIASVLKNSLYG